MGRLRRGQPELAATEHCGGETSHDRLGLNKEIPVHFVEAPSPEEPDNIAINAGAKEGIGAASTGGADGHIGNKVGRIRVEDRGCTDPRGHVGGQNVPKRGRNFGRR